MQLRRLSPEEFELLIELVLYSINSKLAISVKESRKLKRALTHKLEAVGLPEADTFADTLADMKVYEDIEPFIPLLTRPDSQKVLDLVGE